MFKCFREKTERTICHLISNNNNSTSTHRLGSDSYPRDSCFASLKLKSSVLYLITLLRQNVTFKNEFSHILFIETVNVIIESILSAITKPHNNLIMYIATKWRIFLRKFQIEIDCDESSRNAMSVVMKSKQVTIL